MKMMEIKFYRTYSLGERTKEFNWTTNSCHALVIENFETIELAKANARKNPNYGNYRLYEVTLTFDGVIIEQENFIGEILGGYDICKIQRFERIIAENDEHNDRVRWAKKELAKIKKKKS